MSKKVLIIISSIVIVAIGVVSGIWIAVKANEPDKQYVAEKVTDECTEEYEKYKDEEPIVTNAIEERLTPNSKLILKKYYTSCKHTIEENVELPKELVNMSEKEMQKQYPDWEVIGFNSDEAILYKEVEGVCNEHFKITIENNRIVV